LGYPFHEIRNPAVLINVLAGFFFERDRR